MQLGEETEEKVETKNGGPIMGQAWPQVQNQNLVTLPVPEHPDPKQLGNKTIFVTPKSQGCMRDVVKSVAFIVIVVAISIEGLLL